MFTLLYMSARLRCPVHLLECPDRASLLRPGGLQRASGYRATGASAGYRRLSGGRQIAPSGDWASGNPTFTLSCGSPGTTPHTPGHDCRFWALVSFLWVPPAVPRSLRGRPSQVKGACGVAARWRTRHPGPASLHGPFGQRCGQAGGLPSTTRGTPADTTDLDRRGCPAGIHRSLHPHRPIGRS